MYKGAKRGTCIIALSLFALASLLTGCVKSEPVEPTAEPTTEPTPSLLARAFPGADIVQGWTPDGEVETYDSETIFNLVDGQADFFFVYGFEQVAVRRYENADGVVLDVQIWQLAHPEDAYGLFTASIAGEPADVGSEGDVDPGRRLAFWQDRYVVQMFARREIPDADLQSFGEAVSAALPTGGERPALMDRLPADGLVERSAVFFHEELSIQNEVWLGGENLLGLSQETDGVLARYEVGGTTVRLLLIEYPDTEATLAGLAALKGSELESLVAADVQGNLLGAVFGDVDESSVSALLGEALR
jgi:hypothetical protein